MDDSEIMRISLLIRHCAERWELKRAQQPEARVSDAEVRLILDRYRCPVPFHAVRTQFLGNIASPGLSVQPLETVKALWGGELPTFDSLDEVNELAATLIMGLWNQLTRHQDRRSPFRLLRVDVAVSVEGLASVARVRSEEVDAFVDGLFGDAESLDLPERAHRALNVLADVRAFFQAMQHLAVNPAIETTDEVAKTLVNVRKLTRVAEHEIHETVLSCTRARRQILELMTVTKPTIH
jgi:hypothetical protein